MTHDSLCGYRPDVAVDHGVWEKGTPCQCELLSKTRDDQKKEDYQAFRRANLDWHNKFMEDQEGQGYYDWFEMWLNQYTANLTSLVYNEIFSVEEAT